MYIGIAIEETWDFLNEIYADLSEHHQTTLFERRKVDPPFFKERLNRYLFHRDLERLMQNSDVVFFEWASHLLAAATALPKTCGIVTRLHRYEMYQWVDRINWDAVDKIILVSQAKQREFAARFPEQRAKTVVITEAVDPVKFQFSPKPYAGDIGILCHLTPRKRVYDLLMTFYELIQQNDAFHLHIGGGAHPSHGEYYLALQEAVRDLNLTDKVTFYGNVSDTANWYPKVDIFISNSYSEGLQVSPMEAMACGCYCLSHHWAGADELLPEDNLYYTNRELQEKILRYAETPESEKQMQKKKMRTIVVETFNIDRTKVQIRQLIEKVGAGTVSRNGSRP